MDGFGDLKRSMVYDIISGEKLSSQYDPYTELNS